jgi:hypothetical protein
MEILTAVFAGTLLFAGMTGAGLWLLRSGEVRFLPVASALGFALFSFLAWPVVFFLHPVPAWVLYGLSAAGVLSGRRYWPCVWEGLKGWKGYRNRWGHPLALLGLLVLAAAVVNWLTPTKEGDALGGYMFTARRLYLDGLGLIPWNVRYSLFPLNTEMVWALGFSTGTDLTLKWLDGLVGLALFACVYEFARRLGASPLFGFLASASLAVIPDVFNHWSAGKVDMAAGFVGFAAVSLLFDERSTRRLVLSSFLMGAAAACKYTYWIFALPWGVGVWLAYPDRRVRSLLISYVTIGLCVVPHCLRNFIVAGHPLAPFLGGVSYIKHRSDALALPYRYLFGDRLAGPLPPMLLGLLAYFTKRRRARAVLFVASAMLAVWVVARGGDWLVSRFLVVPLALLLCLSALGLGALRHRQRWAFAVLLCLVVAFAGVWSVRHRRASLPFVMGRQSRAGWQEKVAPARAYGAMQRVGPELGERNRLMGNAALYNLPDSAVPFVSTEAEVVEFRALADREKLSHLKARGFGYYLSTSEAPWAEGLEVIDSGAQGGNAFTLYRLPRL